ncbi:MAG: dihydrodipicolinate synthase family protein [Verrucomicrobiales bacterium]|nr:dihydrodipicolinate synthase family protein [Verrucomicrobiales bacterium]
MPDLKRLSGLIAAPHTPFDTTGDVALDVIPRQATHLIDQGITGAFVCGTTGEGASLTVAERCAVTERWVSAAGADLKIIAHVGHTSLGDARTLALHAGSCGAWATSAVAPFYFKPPAVHDLTKHCAEIASAAPHIPFYYYHSPGMTGVNLSPTNFLADAADKIPNLAGIKFNDGDLFQYQRCLAFDNGRFDIPFGVDEALIGGLAAGATSAVGSTYNYAAPIYLELIDAFHRGDMHTARSASQQAVRIVELLIEFGPVAAGKAIMSLHGIDCGSPRSPFSPLAPNTKANLLAAVTEIGLATPAYA